MENLIRLATHTDCTGCSACAAICPKSCIQMKYDGFFRYPTIDEEVCVKCGRCMNVCPTLNAREKRITFNQKYYAGWSSDNSVRKESTSGGVGSALARTAINNGWLVYGAAFDKWVLRHKVAYSEETLKEFQGSKYIESDVASVLSEVHNGLKQERKILFIGTPCQVEAVQRFIPESSKSRLYTCAIICHGVNSPLVWKDYVHYLASRHKGQLIRYNFRSKSHGWGLDSRGNEKLYVSYSFNNGKKVDQPAWKNLFHVWFGKNYMLRECCFNCQYRREQRTADITIGDFWGIEKIRPDLASQEGVSVIITSSVRGDELIRECEHIELHHVDEAPTVKVLRGFVDNRSSDLKIKKLQRMQKFEMEYLDRGFDAMMRDYPCPTFFDKVIASIKFHLHLEK